MTTADQATPTVFADRAAAGEWLARSLTGSGADTVVYGLARGGVEVAAVIARTLRCPLGVLSVRKLALPSAPEFAVGALVADGTTLTDPTATARVPRAQWDAVVASEREEAERRAELYEQYAATPDVHDRSVIVADDGIATGYTMAAACRSLRRRGAAMITAAAPVAAADAVAYLQNFADRVVTVTPPELFRGAVGAHYREFPQRTDSTVIELLKMYGTPAPR